jgi:cystathionine beta-lyase/cystathionine gamma-synthase
MAAHDANGRKVSTWLAERLGAERVFYPGLRSHPQHELACRQMTGFGGMVSVDVKTRENSDKIVTRLKVFTLAESLGGVESLVCHPATMTHASVPADRRAALGIGDGLVRFSVGVEDSQDLLADLERAFEGI